MPLTTVLGGATVTKRGGGDVWSYPSLQGHTAAIANATGTKQGVTFTYDPYGQALAGLPDNLDGDLDYGWHGQAQRGIEHTPGLQPLIQMGARPYHPGLGRFLTTDPILGGSCNDYEYTCADPTNRHDLTGEEWTYLDYDWDLYGDHLLDAAWWYSSGSPRSSGLEDLESAGCLAIAGLLGCAMASEFYELAQAKTLERYGPGETPEANAYRHIIGSAFITFGLGGPTAKALGNLHEEVYPGTDTPIDLFNNRIGRLYALEIMATHPGWGLGTLLGHASSALAAFVRVGGGCRSLPC